MNSDFNDLLSIFTRAKVKYPIVGGYAVSKHSEPRYTKDLDIWVDNSIDNAERVHAALAAFGAPLEGIDAEDFTSPTIVYQIGVPPARINILMGLKEMNFNDCWSRRETVTLSDFEVHYISILDLIENKQRAGRPVDLVDVDLLRKARDRDQSKGS